MADLRRDATLRFIDRYTVGPRARRSGAPATARGPSSVAAILALLSALALPEGARAAETTAASILVKDYDGGKPVTRVNETVVSYVKTSRGSEVEYTYKLEFNPGTARPIGEVSGNRGAPQRVTSAKLIKPSFVAPDGARMEEQTAYYWAKVARDYAQNRIWVTPPNVPGGVSLASEGVQPNVVTSLDNACFGGRQPPACMRVWPHEGPKIHIKAGNVIPEIVVHEFGHYAAGYIFGHMDAIGFTAPAVVGDCAKLAFQEATAEMFKELVLHDARYKSFSGQRVITGQTAKWPIACGEEHTTAGPIAQAFVQALWGTNASGSIKVDWGNESQANVTMAKAFVYALALNRGHRIDLLANNVVAWFAANQPKGRADQVSRIFEEHGFKARRLGESCTGHDQCASFRCDNRPQAGCVSLDGLGQANDFCTTHQQCQSGLCAIPAGKIAGTCSATSHKLGEACSSHAQCTSQRCDNRPGAGCVSQDGRGAANDFCTTHQQCQSGLCSMAAGKIAGTCSATSHKLGEACSSHAQCTSQRCDSRPGAGCVSQDGRGAANDFCTTHQQCQSGLCSMAAGKIAGTCSATSNKLGDACSSHGQCASQRCDNRPGAGCVSQDGRGAANDFCTTHQQCRSGQCAVPGGKIAGKCR